jgi:hypothetical protein
MNAPKCGDRRLQGLAPMLAHDSQLASTATQGGIGARPTVGRRKAEATPRRRWLHRAASGARAIEVLRGWPTAGSGRAGSAATSAAKVASRGWRERGEG